MVPTNSTPRWRDTRLGSAIVRLRDAFVVRRSVDRLVVATAVAGLLLVTATSSGIDRSAPLVIAMFGIGALVIAGYLTLAVVDELAARRVRSSVALSPELDRLDLHGARLRGMYLRQRSMRSVRLSNADLRNADLAGSDLTDARLTEVDLGGANLTGAALAGASLFRIRAIGACLDGVDVTGASLDRGDFRDARLHKATFVQASLRAADLRRADLRETEFWGADLRGADLRGADLRHADLTGANLRGADLRGAKVDGLVAEPSHVRAARGGEHIEVHANEAIRLPAPVIELRAQPEPITGSTARRESRRRVGVGAMALGLVGLAVAGGTLGTTPTTSAGGDADDAAVLAAVQERTSLQILQGEAVELHLIGGAEPEVQRVRLPLAEDPLAGRTDLTAVRIISLDGAPVECEVRAGTRMHRAGPGQDVTCVLP